MCGIVGFVAPGPIEDAAGVVRRMNQSLHHRGPDQDGAFVSADARVGFGHKRLSILDLVNGRQPMTDHEGRFTLVFNGEIYNHRELKADLLRKGHPIRTRSDTETLLYAFREYGEKCPSLLRGMFAFAVHDNRDGSVFLARDHLGIKPLYYGTAAGSLVFASECKAILEFPGFDRAMDLQALSDYLSLMYVPAPKSIFRDIRKLPAGHWLRVRADGSREQGRYWDLRFVDEGEYGAEKEIAAAEEAVLAELDASVALHMESDVPLGAFLSGGVDSTAVVALMARHSKSPVLTNTIGFGRKGYDETDAARESSAHFGTDHAEFQVRPDAVGTLEKLSWFYDEPFADSSMIPTYHVCEMARKRVIVALSGDGGDESFAGYRRYYFDHLENRVRAAIPAWIRRPVFGALGALYPQADWMPQKLRGRTLLRNLSYDPMRGYFTTMSHFQPGMKSGLLSPDVTRALGGYDSLSVFAGHWDNSGSRDPLSRAQYLDVKTYLVDDILTKVDRASMAVSMEVRVPLIDCRFMELAARIPSGWKLKGKTSKHILKRALGKVVPPQVFTRPKSGFSMPLRDWLRNELKGMAGDLLLSRDGAASGGYFRREYVETLWKEHQSGWKDHSFPLFSLLSFSLWHKRFIRG